MRKVELRMNEKEKYDVIKELVDHNGNKNRAADKSISEDIILYKNKYQDWNFHHFKEFLAKDENIIVSYNFIYQALTKAGFLSKKQKRRTKILLF